MFSKGISKPNPFKKVLIAGAAFAGLAVNTNMSLSPGLSLINLATSNKGPFLPSITLLNSEKSNLAPSASKDSDLLANSFALSLPLVPSGIV